MATVESPVMYMPGIFKDVPFDAIDQEIQWRDYGAPRSESYYAKSFVPYTYGRGTGERTYEPHLYDQLTFGVLKHIWSVVDQATTDGHAANFELLFCNRYADQHQHLGWHADDSPSVDPARPIIVVTFGAEREIWWKPMAMLPSGGRENAKRDDGVQKRILEHGSVFIMDAGMQQTHLHRIPKHSRPCGPRVSLTFRGLTPGREHFHDKH